MSVMKTPHPNQCVFRCSVTEHSPFFSSPCHFSNDARFGVQDVPNLGEPPVENPAPAPPAAGFFFDSRTVARLDMTDLTDEEINHQIEAAYETLRAVVEELGKKGASTLTLGVALIGVAVEIAVSVTGREDGERLVREIVEDRLAAHIEVEQTTL
jgi:hypothetical protein